MSTKGKNKESTKTLVVTNGDLNEIGLEPYLEKIKAKYQAQSDLEGQAKEAAAEVHQKIGRTPEQQWLPFAPMPTDMCRVSPFFPMAQKQLKDRPHISEMVITKSSWGEITYSGPKLSVYEEDVLMAILAIMGTSEKQKGSTETKGSYTYIGPLRPVLTLMGYQSTGAKNYTRVLNALSLMAQATVKLSTSKGKSWFITSMLTAAGWDADQKRLLVTINPYFYEAYTSGGVTLIEVLKRAKLSKPISKALYRFVMSHQGDRWSGHFLTLAATLNLDIEQPHFQLRRQIKAAITELIKHGTLSAKSQILRDVVTLLRNSGKKKISN